MGVFTASIRPDYTFPARPKIVYQVNYEQSYRRRQKFDVQIDVQTDVQTKVLAGWGFSFLNPARQCTLCFAANFKAINLSCCSQTV